MLAVGLAGLTYQWLGGVPGDLGKAQFPAVLLPALAADVVFALVNAVLLATVVSLSSGSSPWRFLRDVLLPSAPSYVGYGIFGLLLATLWLNGLGPAAALLLLAPLVIARWAYAQYAAQQEAYEATVRTFVQAVETKDLYTRGHSERVAHGAVMVGRTIGMPDDRLESLRYSGLLHDLGKVSIATRILHKTGRLDEDEFTAIRRHPEHGVQIVRDIEFLDEARAGIRHHHERLDGRGYPDGLAGRQIPQFARIICVADAFDAMTTVRSYRGARSHAEARAELERGSGTQFDPTLVDAFLSALDRDGWQVPPAPVVDQETAGEAPSTIISDHDDPRMSLPEGGGPSVSMTTSTVPARARPGSRAPLLLVTAAVVVYSISVTLTVVDRQRPWTAPEVGFAFAFGGFVALGELVRVTLPGERVQAPLALAGSLGYTFLFQVASERVTIAVPQVVVVCATGMLVGSVPHAFARRDSASTAVARRILVVGLAAVAARPLLNDPAFDPASLRVPVALLLLVIAGLAVLLDGALSALLVASRDRTPLVAALSNELRAVTGIGAAVGITGLLVAEAAPVMGLWAIPVLSIPLLLTQLSFRRYAAIRATYLQTVRSLSRVTDLAGYTDRDHARRVSRLAVAMGRELGMTDAQLLDLEYAALMHDIGQLSLHDPVPGGATLRLPPEERRRIAELGAAVVRQTGVLDRVATIVEAQAEPYRRPMSGADDEVPLAARVLKAANAYDDIVGASADPALALEGVERLRLGMAYEYEPRVVQSLTTVLRHRRP